MRRIVLTMFLAASAACTTQAPPVDPAAHRAEIEAWRAERVERLMRPDNWLALVGLHWFEPGSHTVGSGEDNAIRLATGPARLGTLTFEGDSLRFAPAEDAGIRVGGELRRDEFALVPDSAGPPTVVEFEDGKARLQVIARSGRHALRVRDERANTRVGFTGIDYYPIDPAWRLEARFEPHPPGTVMEVVNVLGMFEQMPNPGVVVFEKDGREFRLEALDEGDGRLFLVIADRTTGRETYGAGRTLYADAAVDGRTVVDFNRAYNPPCAFTAHSTCVLPPPGNRMDLAVTAGEKKYTGPTE